MSALHAGPCLQTERLVLRPWREDDVEPFFAMMAEPEAARFLSAAGQPMDRAEAWRTLAVFVGHWALCGFGLFAVEERQSGAFVGRVGGWRPEGRAGTELGWGLARGHWGKGYAQEAARAAGDWMFASLKLDQIVSLIHGANQRSRRLPGPLGMALDGHTFHAGLAPELWRVDRARWPLGIGRTEEPCSSAS